MPAIEMTNPAALPADWRDLLALTKPRVMSLVVFSGLCGLLAPPSLRPLVVGGLGRRAWHCRAAAAAIIRDHLPVDAAALLGAVTVRPLRLCRRRDPDVAGCRRRREHASPDFPLQPADGGRRYRAVGVRA